MRTYVVVREDPTISSKGFTSSIVKSENLDALRRNLAKKLDPHGTECYVVLERKNARVIGRVQPFYGQLAWITTKWTRVIPDEFEGRVLPPYLQPPYKVQQAKLILPSGKLGKTLSRW